MEITFGYQTDGAPDERFTSTGGMEVTMKYHGPALFRYDFLGDIFGQWRYVRFASEDESWNPANDYQSPCAVCLVKKPSPYVTLGQLHPGPEEEGFYCHEPLMDVDNAHCLWPDTFDIVAGDPMPVAEAFPCYFKDGASPPSLETRPAWLPHNYACTSEITVNYRAKSHACWPNSVFVPECGSSVADRPTIPTGTYVEVRLRGNTEYQTTDSGSYRYKPVDSEDYSVTLEYWEDCASKVPSVVRDEIGLLVQTTTMDVNWSNVPLPPWKYIQEAQGCVNATAFLGYPPESVMFYTPDYLSLKSFNCVDLFNMHYVFVAKTTAVLYGGPDGNRPILLDEDAKMLNGKIGVWNRRWSPCPLSYTSGSYWICTNFVELEGVGACNALKSGPYKTYDFNKLFQLPTLNGFSALDADVMDCAP